MYIKPRRTRAGLAFLGGLSVSVMVLAAGAFLVHSQADRWMEEAHAQAREEVEQDWLMSHPMEPVYVFARDMQTGDVLDDQDLVLCEMPAGLLPADVLVEPERARGLVVRGAVKANTLCTSSLLYGREEFPDDARLQEFTSIRLPSRLEADQCIDVRVTFPNGLDYVVLAKKAVQSVEASDAGTGSRIWLTVNEEEILRISSAIVDAYLHPGTVLYALTYVAPDIQQAAICTYPANAYVQDLIRQNPNILTHAVTELDKANREWFDSIPDPVPNQPLAVIPAPGGPLAAASSASGEGPSPLAVPAVDHPSLAGSGMAGPDGSGPSGTSPTPTSPPGTSPRSSDTEPVAAGTRDTGTSAQPTSPVPNAPMSVSDGL